MMWRNGLQLLAVLSLVLGSVAPVTADQWVYEAITDPSTQIVKTRRPFRQSWLKPGQLTVEEDGSIRHRDGWVLRPVGQYQYAFSNAPDLAYLIQQSAAHTGVQFAPVMRLEQWLNDWFVPQIQREGYVLHRSYPLPEVAHAYAQLDINPYLGQQPAQHAALGTEWTNEAGGRSFALLVHVVFQAYNQMNWGVLIRELRADEDTLDRAAADFIYSEANTEINPNWVFLNAQKAGIRIRETDAKWQNIMAGSRQAHWQRMNAIQARGQASQQIAKANSDVLDISHSGYMNRSNLVSSGQQHSVRGIAGQTLIANPTSGETYQVGNTARYHWVDTTGAYLSTDKVEFDPGLDARFRDSQWTRFDVID
ncbi:MAG: hypothetical protein AAF499_16320 [Pseudomonadota bacterium]